MYQFSIPIGKSATADVTVADVLATMPLPQGTIGLCVGTTTGANGALLLRYSEYVIEHLLDKLKVAVPQRQLEVFYTPATCAFSSAATSVGLETAIAAALNTPFDYAATRSELIKAGLYRCLDRFREELNAGNLPLLVQ